MTCRTRCCWLLSCLFVPWEYLYSTSMNYCILRGLHQTVLVKVEGTGSVEQSIAEALILASQLLSRKSILFRIIETVFLNSTQTRSSCGFSLAGSSCTRLLCPLKTEFVALSECWDTVPMLHFGAVNCRSCSEHWSPVVIPLQTDSVHKLVA